MSSNRAEKMGAKSGLSGLVDKLRYHEISRQGLGLLLIPVCSMLVEPGQGRIFLGLALATLGQIWRIYAAGVIYKNRQLASTGAYSLVRHPLYLGNLLILGGFTLACSNWLVVVLVIGFFLFYYPAAIRYEDAKLEDIFADEWRTWSKDIPAMFPTSLKWKANTDASWNARQSLLRNGELPISIYLIFCAWLMLNHVGMV
jgi:hypothetical protein